MDDDRFDTLTRTLTDFHSRRGALATLLGGTPGLFGLVARDETAAKRRHHARKPPCRKLKASCKPKGKMYQRCCDKINQLHCDIVAGSSNKRCCYDYQQVCSGAPGECCRDLTCGSVPALSGSRCCAKLGSTCFSDNDCCDAAPCIVAICGGSPPCVDSGQPCPDNCDLGALCSGCCDGTCNRSGACAPDGCAPYGMPCVESADCCDGIPCIGEIGEDNRFCRFP